MVATLTSDDIAHLSLPDAAALLSMRKYGDGTIKHDNQKIREIRERVDAIDRELADLLTWLDGVPGKHFAEARKKVLNWVLLMRPEREKLWTEELRIRLQEKMQTGKPG